MGFINQHSHHVWGAPHIFNILLIGRLEHFLIFHILGIIIPTDEYIIEVTIIHYTNLVTI